MKTFAERYAEAHGCAPTEFCDRVFWSSLHRPAVALAPLLLLLGNHFAPDRALVAACGRARSLREIHEEIECFWRDPQNTGWLRKRLRIRVSVKRLQRTALPCFAPTQVAPLTSEPQSA